MHISVLSFIIEHIIMYEPFASVWPASSGVFYCRVLPRTFKSQFRKKKQPENKNAHYICHGLYVGQGLDLDSAVLMMFL